ncbi:MAG: hypothetical protein V1885_03140 [Candidatus Brennerbacteria bacterium]
MNHKTDWRELLSGINVHEIGELSALRKLCEIGRYFPIENLDGVKDQNDFWSTLCGHIAEITHVNCDYQFSRSDLGEIEGWLNDGKDLIAIMQMAPRHFFVFQREPSHAA